LDETAVREDDRVEKAMKDMQPSKVTGYYEITDFWKEHTQMWGKDPETVKYEIADWMVDEMKPDNTPEREELTKRAWAIVDDALKNNKDDMTFDDMIDQLKGKSEDTDELSRLKELSGIREDDSESKYYEYTGKAFAIRPSGESVWADKADIPSVINVESIMISHYPDMDDYVELTMEHDGPWEIYTDKAVEAALEKTLGMPSGSIKWSEQGQQEKGRAHFDVASTAIGKVAGSSMFKQVQAEESFKPFPEEDEMTFEDDDAFYEAFGELGFPEDETELFDAEYRGRKVPLNKPMRGDVKKFKVYVKDPKTGNVKKVNFGHGGSSARKAGQKTMKIRKSNPKARKSFRARHNCANPGPKTKARYWSCRKW
jgi:hypothetical protein